MKGGCSLLWVLLAIVMAGVCQDVASQRRVNPVKSASQGLQGKMRTRIRPIPLIIQNWRTCTMSVAM